MSRSRDRAGAPAGAVVDPAALAELLAGWLPRQRWFPAKSGGVPQVRLAGELALSPAPADDPSDPATGGPAGTAADEEPVELRVHLVTAVPATGRAVTCQVPLAYHRAPDESLAAALIGRVDDPDGSPRWVYDAPHDPAFVRAWLDLVAGERELTGPGAAPRARAVRSRPERPPLGPSGVLRGEQSNTSVIVDADGPDPVIGKLFRVLHDGPNPDVLVQTRLAAAGCERVPRPVGWIEGEWLDPDGEKAGGHLAYLCAFLPGSEDAWRVACRAVESGASFAEPARQLGTATAEVHVTLARAMPTQAPPADLLDRLADELLARTEWAASEVPELGQHLPAARAAVATVRTAGRVPRLQRVHGDYHLGQVLHTVRHGWVLLDFEGEPLRPLAERNRPDLALRDVAGMLRSFDYAARHATIGLADDDPRVRAAAGWAGECERAFLAGYAEAAGRDPREDDALLRALILDKALYEVVYEARNRPDWLSIPLGAVRRLLDPAGAT